MPRFTLGLLFAVVACGVAPAQSRPKASAEEALVADVNKAIEKGVQYLRVNRDRQTQWENYTLRFVGMEGGGTSLATLALLNCGLKPDDKDVAGGLDFIRKLKPKSTYVVALATLALAEARQAVDLPRIQVNVDWLLKTARRDGGKLVGWAYPHDEADRPDASNTQYALLGLYAGKQSGAKIDEAVWKEIQALYLRTMAKESADTGSWKYVEGAFGGGGASFTMTVAGVSGLVIANMALDANGHGLDPATGVSANCGKYDSNDAIRMGLNWIGKNFAFEGAQESKSAFYNTYGIERVGRLSGQRFLGKADWYREGCQWLVKVQNRDGYWSRGEDKGLTIDGIRVVSTSFALLFLSKGRSPVLISKLAYGDHVFPERGVLAEKGEKGIIGWNRKQNDARNLTDFCSREVFKGIPLGWQVYDPRRVRLDGEKELLEEVGVLVQSPILYLSGHDAPKLTGQQKDLLKKYVEEGGFVVAEACCGSKDFADGFRRLMAELFPDNELKKLPPEHAIWRTFFAVPPTEFPKLEGMNRGCRTVLVFSPEPLAGFWEETKFMPKASVRESKVRGENAFRLGANVVAYATGMEPPKQRLTVRKIEANANELKAPPKGFVKPAQIKLDTEPAPAPAAMRNLMGYVRDVARLDVVPAAEPVFPANEDLIKYKFMYLHGRKEFTWEPAEMDNVKVNLQTGGLLLADACCGSEKFDAAFRAMIGKMFADEKLKLEPIPLDDKLYSEKVNGGTAIKTVKRREKVGNAATGNDGGFEDLPPKLEGIKLDGRWVVVYSRYDIGCALEGHKSTDCLGHTPESAKRLAAAAVLYSLKRGN